MSIQIKMMEGDRILLNFVTTIFGDEIGLKKQGLLKVQLFVLVEDNQLVITHNECKKPLKIRMGKRHKSLKKESQKEGFKRIMKSKMKETEIICIDLDNREWEKEREKERERHEKEIRQKETESGMRVS